MMHKSGFSECNMSNREELLRNEDRSQGELV